MVTCSLAGVAPLHCEEGPCTMYTYHLFPNPNAEILQANQIATATCFDCFSRFVLIVSLV